MIKYITPNSKYYEDGKKPIHKQTQNIIKKPGMLILKNSLQKINDYILKH